MTRFGLECLESRRMLASDASVIHVDSVPSEPGELQERQVQVFSGDGGEIQVRSWLTNELVAPQWQRFDAFGRKFTDVATERSSILGFQGAIQLQQIGDLNGDDVDDVLMQLAADDYVVVWGGVTDGFDFRPLMAGEGCSEMCEQLGPRLKIAVPTDRGNLVPPPEFRSIGDVNGDGFDDLALTRLLPDTHALSIIYGNDQLAWDTEIEVGDSPTEFTSIVDGVSDMEFIGDINQDSKADVVVGRWNYGLNWLPDYISESAHVFYGNNQLLPNTRLSIDELSEQGALSDSLGQVQRPSAVGDFNGDGLNDFVIEVFSEPGSEVSRQTRLYFGDLERKLSFSIVPDDVEAWGFRPSTLLSGFRAFNSSGDFNGDGLSDLLFSFSGRDCDCGASGRPHVTTGLQVIYGSRNDPSSLPSFSKRTEYLLDQESPFAPYPMPGRSRFFDSDGDELADIAFHTANGTIVIRGTAVPESIDFGHVSDGSTGFDGHTIYGFREVRDVLDINGDGIGDYRISTRAASARMVLGTPRIPTGSGEGNIDETIAVPAGRSVIYEATGWRRGDATAIESTVYSLGEQRRLQDNVISDRDGVLLDVDFQPSDDPELIGRIIVTNHGPNNARDVLVQSELSGHLGEIAWKRNANLFPTTIYAEDMDLGIGTKLIGPAYLNVFGLYDLSPRPAQRERYFHNPFQFELGREVGSLGDVNGDGFDDVYVIYRENGVDRRLDFLGGPDFAENGFRMSVSVPSPRRSTSAQDATGDLNGDGEVDNIVVTDYYPPNVHITLSGEDFLGPEEVSVEFAPSLVDVSPRVVSQLDVNGDGVDDLLIGDPYRSCRFCDVGVSNHVSAYLIFGRSRIDPREGHINDQGVFSDRVDIPVGAKIVYELSGAASDTSAISGRIQVNVSEEQLDLDTQVKQVVFGTHQILGDINGSGTVDYDDFLVLSANFGSTGATPEQGDLDGDQKVSFADFLILSANFG